MMAPSAGATPSLLFSISIFLTVFSLVMAVGADQTVNLGAIVNLGSRIGKEQKIAMEIAVEDFNRKSKGHNLSLRFRNTNAEELIKKDQAIAIVGMETWQESALVADVGSEFRVPILSLASPSASPPLASRRWPYLLQMDRSSSRDALSDPMMCLTSIVSLYRWKRVIVIYEEEPYGGDSGAFFLLSQALQEIGATIEYSISLPPSQSLQDQDPKRIVETELNKLIHERCYSRVFIVLQLSSNVAGHLFVTAGEKGLVGEESVWIITEKVANYLLSLNDSALSSIEGALGIKANYTTSSDSFQDFEARFWLNFSKEYPEERNPEPGFHASLAYDGVNSISNAMGRSNTSLLEQIQATNFTGLSGHITFEEDSKLLHPRGYSIVNVAHKGLKKVDFWTPGVGFVKSRSDTTTFSEGVGLDGNVIWPGNSTIPKGWAMPNKTRELRIGVPDSYAFNNFVEVRHPATTENNYSGLCIKIFEEVVGNLTYNLPYQFFPYNDTYSTLIDMLYKKNIDAVVGDFTVLSNRTMYVDFTQPYLESGLAMILSVNSNGSSKGWIFLRPFRKELWLATLGIMIYTVLVVWFLEHRDNPEFRGPWRNQLSTALWFTFSSLFFSQRESIRSSYTRVVVIVWLFVVLVLTQSYTADLSSMLTAARLKQNETDFQTLVTRKAKVGCHNASFVKGILSDVLKFETENIVEINTQLEYFHSNFTAGKITAAFLEIPYARIFLNRYCDQYTLTTVRFSFGGFGFAFPKGSPIAIDVSRGILNQTEKGSLKQLQEKWLNTTSRCSDENNADNIRHTESLGLSSFWGLFALSAATSTLCFLGSFIPLMERYITRLRQVREENSAGRTNIWNTIVLILASCIFSQESRNSATVIEATPGPQHMWQLRSSNWIPNWIRVVPYDNQFN